MNFSQPIRDNVNENISGQFGQIALKLYGDDLDDAAEAGRAREGRARRACPAWPISAIVKSGEVPQIQVEPDRVALARYGMALGDFQHVFQTAVGGRPVADFWEGERRFDVVMRFPLGARDDVEKLRQAAHAGHRRGGRAARRAGARRRWGTAARRSTARTAGATSASA